MYKRLAGCFCNFLFVWEGWSHDFTMLVFLTFWAVGFMGSNLDCPGFSKPRVSLHWDKRCILVCISWILASRLFAE